MSSVPAPVAVFAGGCAGGALRLGLDELVPSSGSGLPIDIVAINVIGAFALGGLTGWVLMSGPRQWAPMLGTGALGAFTTFSALAALPWLADVGAATAVVLLAVTMAASVAAAGAGWPLGVRLATAQARRAEEAP